MNEITYSQKLGGENSEEYYRTVRKFADEVIVRSIYSNLNLSCC